MNYKVGDIVDIIYGTLRTVGTVMSIGEWNGKVYTVKLLKEDDNYDRAIRYLDMRDGSAYQVGVDVYYFAPAYLFYNKELNRNKHIDNIINV